MDRTEFNHDLNSYLDQRRGKKSGQGIFYFFQPSTKRSTHQKPRTAPAEEAPAKSVHNQHEKELETMEAKLDEVNEIEDSVEEKREGLLKGFFRKLHVWSKESEQSEADDLEPTEEAPVDEDVKRILKMTYGWLNHLPEEKILAFKNSEDFNLYKRVLGQYGLIKQKAPDSETTAPAEHASEGSDEDS